MNPQIGPGRYREMHQIVKQGGAEILYGSYLQSSSLSSLLSSLHELERWSGLGKGICGALSFGDEKQKKKNRGW